jgi:hypothetical protein
MPETIRIVNVDDVRAVIEHIRQISGDSERAHIMEDKLHQAVLRAIADGTCENPVGCAQDALVTQKIEFERWHA